MYVLFRVFYPTQIGQNPTGIHTITFISSKLPQNLTENKPLLMTINYSLMCILSPILYSSARFEQTINANVY